MCPALLVAAFLHIAAPSKVAPRSHQAVGAFEVTVKPLAGDPEWGAFGRLSIDKRFHGDLEGTSRGQMLAEGDGKGEFGGYVALERVTGTLNGRMGTFVLQHSGTLTRRVPEMVITVVPGSGTGELQGLSGRFRIVLENGRHTYAFDYTLPPQP